MLAAYHAHACRATHPVGASSRDLTSTGRGKEAGGMRRDSVLRRDVALRRASSAAIQAVELQRYRGLEHAARVKAANYVAHVGMTLAAQLSAEEGVLIQACPLAE